MILFSIDAINAIDRNRGSDTYVTSMNQRSIKEQSKARICLLDVPQAI